jgi:alkanesulfonate monooxygenase SsuD/methylene tetrahydromethanopterin reductase-like flavin-dependent oxidoreductase (luciferase family)
MRVGLSWTLDPALPTGAAWDHLVDEAVAADTFGYDSVWVHEDRSAPHGVSSPSILLTFLSRRCRNVALIGHRLVTHVNPVRLAEEIGVLDVFSRGRAGLSFAAARGQGVDAEVVHETVDFVTSAWALDEFAYRGRHLRFPTHTPDDAPLGASTAPRGGRYVPQWERGPAMPDHLAITPKPVSPRPPVHVEITDDDTLVWAAEHGVSPLLPATVPHVEVVDRLEQYHARAAAVGRLRREVDVAVERRIVVGGDTDDVAFGGRPDTLVDELRDLAAAGGITHLVWQRHGPADGDLFQFASQVQLLLQA